MVVSSRLDKVHGKRSVVAAVMDVGFLVVHGKPFRRRCLSYAALRIGMSEARQLR